MTWLLWELLHFIRIYLEDTLSLFKMPNCFKIFLRSLLKVIITFRDFEQVFCKILTYVINCKSSNKPFLC
ncbi:hypothetical protein AR546_07595 [Leptospira interrogans serovar Canicola]|nr:hypothetical protein AMR47_01650 [Leptospira interrogans]ASV06627.1 hypothetical protein B2G47_12695 [Leptospira interrogans serovar Canicola]OOC00001.1 hypothetical protein B0192_02045 [Leptospira interrogans serovar Australis]ASV08659.1 hypothetical protein B2G50_06170 [Leptospira interrogans serovar Canicola]OLZ31940.1 hypothetical protein AR546_07595 [Leptospira interrogans serovar Canicola]